MLTADSDHVWIRVVGHVVLFFEHRAHFTHAAGLFAEEFTVGSIPVLQQDGLALVARFVTGAAVDAAIVVTALGVHNRMTTSTDRERYIYTCILREGKKASISVLGKLVVITDQLFSGNKVKLYALK